MTNVGFYLEIRGVSKQYRNLTLSGTVEAVAWESNDGSGWTIVANVGTTFTYSGLLIQHNIDTLLLTALAEMIRRIRQ